MQRLIRGISAVAAVVVAVFHPCSLYGAEDIYMYAKVVDKEKAIFVRELSIKVIE